MNEEAKVVLGFLWVVTWAFAVPLPALVMSMVFNYRPTPYQWAGSLLCLVLYYTLAKILIKVQEEVTK